MGRGDLDAEDSGGTGGTAINVENIPALPTALVGTRWETGRMRLYRDRAVVLRQHKLGEADRIVTLLTREHGLVRAVAKGVRRTRSKFGSRLEPFAHIDVQLHPGRNLDIVTQVQAIDAFAADIVSDYGRYTCACAVLETAERLAGEERAPVPALHRLTVGALRAVADGSRPWELVLDAYLLRAMGIAGWAPALTECARCAAPGPHRAFHIAAGGSVCVHCRPSGSTTPPQAVLDLMSALTTATGTSPRRRSSRTATRPAGWWPRICSGISSVSSAHCRWSNACTGSIARSPTTGFRCSGRMSPVVMKRAAKTTYPQLPPAPDDYPTFPDKSSWPVVFPELPPHSQRQVRPPAPAHLEGRRAQDSGRPGAQPRRRRHGRQWPVGHPAGAAPHRGPQDG